MRLTLILYLPVILFLSCYTPAFSQDEGNDTISSLNRVSDKYYTTVSSRLHTIEEKVGKKSVKALQQFIKQEKKLLKKFTRIDSNAARQLMSDATEKYTRLQQQLYGSQKQLQYIPYLDTLKTSLKFLDQNPQFLSQT